MMTNEYAELVTSADESHSSQRNAYSPRTQIVDSLIIVAYVVGVISIMPFLVTYAWVRDTLKSRST